MVVLPLKNLDSGIIHQNAQSFKQASHFSCPVQGPCEQSERETRVGPFCMMTTMGSQSHKQSAPMTVLEQHLAVSSDQCPMCDYNLHKLKGNTCPECGHGLELRVAVSNPRMAAFYTGLLGLAAGTGFAALVLAFAATIYATRTVGGGPCLGEMTLLLIEAIVLGGLTIVWIRCSGRIRRMETWARWSLAIGCCWLSFVAMLVFAAVVD